METITLHRTADCWVARFTDPEVRRMFGTDTLPTAFTSSAPAAAVLKEVQRLNPGANVTLADHGIQN